MIHVLLGHAGLAMVCLTIAYIAFAMLAVALRSAD